jgi:hypothetical protein
LKHMDFTYTKENEDGTETEVTVKVPQKWEICGNCDGEGRHMNSAIRNHAYTPEEFNEAFDDEESRHAYFNGGYDVNCEDCLGEGKILVVNEEAFEVQDKEAYDAWVEGERQERYIDRENEAERRFEAGCEAAITGNWDDFYDGNY